MEALLYFALWAGLIFLMMRFGCGAHIMGHGHGRDTAADSRAKTVDPPSIRWIPPETDTDPVCGRTVKTDRAKSSVYDGNVYYFCSRECREVFEAAPEQHLGDDKPNTPGLEHSHA